VTRIVSILGFCICAALIVVLTLGSRRNPDKVTPFGELLDRVVLGRASRVAIIVCWWWLGWHFLFAQTVAN
jgi:hypothetical protein